MLTLSFASVLPRLPRATILRQSNLFQPQHQHTRLRCGRRCSGGPGNGLWTKPSGDVPPLRPTSRFVLPTSCAGGGAAGYCPRVLTNCCRGHQRRSGLPIDARRAAAGGLVNAGTMDRPLRRCDFGDVRERPSPRLPNWPKRTAEPQISESAIGMRLNFESVKEQNSAEPGSNGLTSNRPEALARIGTAARCDLPTEPAIAA
jgi:hypothetical protein